MKRYFLFIFAVLPLIGLFPTFASAATLGFGGSTSVAVGQTVNVPVLVSAAAGESVNAVSSGIAYPSNLLTLVAISKTGSIINLWPSEPIVGAGSGSFEGVILNPGYSGQRGTVVVLTFEANAPGVAAVTFTDPSVLANDGNATPILTGTSPDAITISAAVPVVAPSKPITKPVTHPATSSVQVVLPTSTAPTTSAVVPGTICGLGYSVFIFAVGISLLIMLVLLKGLLYLLGYNISIKRRK